MTDRKIVDYVVVDYRFTDERYRENGTLKYNPVEFMQDILSKGYQPYGNLVKSETHYAQAMVKYEGNGVENFKKQKSNITEFLQTKIDDIGFTTRTENVLKAENIYTVNDFKKIGLCRIIGMGKSTRIEIFHFLMKFICEYEEKE